MDYQQLKKTAHGVLIKHKPDIRRDVWKVLALLWMYSAVYVLLVCLFMPKDIVRTQLSFHVIGGILKFVSGTAAFMLSVGIFRVLFRYFPAKAKLVERPEETGRLSAILFRCVVLGLLQSTLSTPVVLTKVLPLISQEGDSLAIKSLLLFFMMIASIISMVFFSIFLPCFIAQGCSIADSFRLAVRLILDLLSVIRFYVRVLLPINLLIWGVALLFMVPLLFLTEYLDKLYFLQIYSVLSGTAAVSVTTGLWMKTPYYNLCVMEYTDIRQR